MQARGRFDEPVIIRCIGDWLTVLQNRLIFVVICRYLCRMRVRAHHARASMICYICTFHLSTSMKYFVFSNENQKWVWAWLGVYYENP
jgi:hypothetical protein